MDKSGIPVSIGGYRKIKKESFGEVYIPVIYEAELNYRIRKLVEGLSKADIEEEQEKLNLGEVVKNNL